LGFIVLDGILSHLFLLQSWFHIEDACHVISLQGNRWISRPIQRVTSFRFSATDRARGFRAEYRDFAARHLFEFGPTDRNAIRGKGQTIRRTLKR